MCWYVDKKTSRVSGPFILRHPFLQRCDVQNNFNMSKLIPFLQGGTCCKIPLFWVLNKCNSVHYAGILSGVTSHAPHIRILSFFDSCVFWKSQDFSQCMFLREVGTWWLVKHIALTTYLIWSHIPPVSLWLTSNFPERQAWSTGTSYLGFHGDNGSWEDGPFHIYTYACNK